MEGGRHPLAREQGLGTEDRGTVVLRGEDRETHPDRAEDEGDEQADRDGNDHHAGARLGAPRRPGYRAGSHPDDHGVPPPWWAANDKWTVVAIPWSPLPTSMGSSARKQRMAAVAPASPRG